MSNYFHQEKFYTCGPACLRMILADFNINTSEEDLEQILGTNNTIGTTPENLIAGAAHYNLQVKSGESATFEHLDTLIQEGWLIIVAYALDVPHYSIYDGNNGNHVFLRDPFFGPKNAILKRKFDKAWKVDHKGFETYHCQKWYVAYKK